MDETLGWHHQLNGHEFEQTQGDGEGQGSLVYCSPWVTKNWTWLTEKQWRLRDWRKWRGAFNSYMVSLGVIKNILNLIVVMVSQFCEYTKSHWTVHIFFFWLHFVACGILVLWPGIKPLHWKCGLVTTGPSQKFLFFLVFLFLCGTFFKVFPWIFYNTASVLCFGFWPWGMWDLVPLPRIKTSNSALED